MAYAVEMGFQAAYSAYLFIRIGDAQLRQQLRFQRFHCFGFIIADVVVAHQMQRAVYHQMRVSGAR